MANDDLPEKAPKRRAADVAQAVTKLALSQVPLAGAPAAALFDYLVRPSYERRQAKWIESVVSAVNDLADKVEDLERLQADEPFLTTLIEASNIAVRTHQEEKLEALRNAVINAALHTEPDDDLRAIFLTLVDRFTPWHLRILKLFDNPKVGLEAAGVDYSGYNMGGPNRVLEDAYPDLKEQRQFYDLLISDLSAAGLFSIGSLHGAMTSDGMLARRTTPIGRRFLAFVSEPPATSGLRPA